MTTVLIAVRHLHEQFMNFEDLTRVFFKGLFNTSRKATQSLPRFNRQVSGVRKKVNPKQRKDASKHTKENSVTETNLKPMEDYDSRVNSCFFPSMKLSQLYIYDLQEKAPRDVALLISFAEDDAVCRDPEFETSIDGLVNVNVDQDLRVLSHAYISWLDPSNGWGY